MAKIRMPRGKNKQFTVSVIVAAVLVVALIVILIAAKPFGGLENTMGEKDSTGKSPASGSDGGFNVYYVDVGQGDCEVIVCDGVTMMIDAGENGHESDVFEFLDSKGIKTLDYVVATHPHSDHIGGMPEVIENYEVKNFIMPRLTEEQTPTTSIYTKMIDALSESKAAVYAAEPGDVYEIGSAKAEILGPVTDETTDLNSMSVMIKVTYGENTFLFTGDAEKEEEDSVRLSGADLDCDVLKVGHHGSSSSCTKEFLKAVTPEYCIISVGADNSYGHPTKEALNRLKAYTSEIYRTDRCGTITVTSDGSNIKVTYGE